MRALPVRVPRGLLLGQHVLQHANDQPDQEEAVGDDVVVVPEGEVSLLEPGPALVGLLQPPEEAGGADVSEEVRGDEDREGAVHPVDVGGGGLVHVAEHQRDEQAVGESRVDGAVQGHSPLLGAASHCVIN